MSDVFEKRYSNLNQKQRQAVDQIDGPLLVIAGPGTGKTELLSMRAANILRQTDTLPSSIVCLTFTESGAAAMRKRLTDIIGADAYKVAIYTFHGFGTEIINQNSEYFYRGARFQPADELKQYEIMRQIFNELDYTNPLAGMNGDEYTHLRDTMQAISELKRSGLTSDELRQIIDDNDSTLDSVERDITQIFSNKVSKTMIEQLAPVAEKVAKLPSSKLPSAITPYANVLALSIAHAVDEALETGKTPPITAWKKKWLTKNDHGDHIFADRRRHDKLRATSHIYYQYLTRMEAAGLYDYDDMILGVIHAMETQADLRANLQEKYQYVMVDEFQDTNLAQLRLLFNLTGATEQPNVMAVGDDDQAIYSFQGADIGNIQRFRSEYSDPDIIVLGDNYRSAEPILTASRVVITQGAERLENTVEGLSKQLTPHMDTDNAQVDLRQYNSVDAERSALAASIRQQIDDGVRPDSIAVIARRHNDLVSLLPHLAKADIAVNYERRDNILEHPVILTLENTIKVIDALQRNAHDQADALLPEILAHPAYGFAAGDIYKLSLASYRNHQQWLETMQTMPVFAPFANWLLERSKASHSESLEQQIDILLGVPDGDEDEPEFVSPLYAHFFSDENLAARPDAYLDTLEALRTVRDRLREHYADAAPTLQSFLSYLQVHRELKSTLMAVRHRGDAINGMINLLTAHKSKGLEFEHVYIYGAIDSQWGERVRSRSRLIGYPANLPLAPAGDSYDERLRLFFVAMTRAKQTLTISYSQIDTSGKESLVASFLSDVPTIKHNSTSGVDDLVTQAEIDWRQYLTSSLDNKLHDLLAPTLEKYKLSATHLGNFLDVSRGGPQYFLLNNLLRFPQAKSSHAAFGTAIHTTLQQAHDHIRAGGSKRAIEDILRDFEKILHDQHLPDEDFETFHAKGVDALSVFLTAKYDSFDTNQRTELGFGGQNVFVGEAHLTGALDLADIDETEKTIVVTDYKTGKPSLDWKGRTDYEKIKLHKYRHQLMFYQLLIENSRDYSKYSFDGGVLQFVEPTKSGGITSLEGSFSTEEMDQFRRLIAAVWRCITTLQLPDISQFEPNYKGMLEFEEYLLNSID